MLRSRREALLKEYGEVGQMFRKLTDIRFRLLGFVPLISGASTAIAVAKFDKANVGVLFFGLFGLCITIGLIIYNARNDQLYNELVGRATSIERTLGLHDGYFSNRPQAWLRIGSQSKNGSRPQGLKIDHGTALWLIYGTAVSLWLSLLSAETFEFARLGYFKYFCPRVCSQFCPFFVVTCPTRWTIAIAIIISICATYSGGRMIKSRLKARRRELIRRAAAAYRAALILMTEMQHSKRDIVRFVRHCIALSGEADKTRQRRRFYSHLDSQSLVHYWGPGSDRERASHLVALLTDFPPRWIFECGEGKHLNVTK